ncbi:MAG: hypothetical protein IJX46_07785 [Clostridia bacterium]|nr:hypothetical protein [Clostridia bacterium]
MREILFRGKTEKGEWVEGLLWKKKHNTDKIFISCFPDHDDNEEVFPVKPETVGQYTGLTDKNGKKIFEGDIVDICYPYTIVHNALINYVGASFYGDNGNDLWSLDEYFYLEVISNIHDNPELLNERR